MIISQLVDSLLIYKNISLQKDKDETKFVIRFFKSHFKERNDKMSLLIFKHVFVFDCKK